MQAMKPDVVILAAATVGGIEALEADQQISTTEP